MSAQREIPGHRWRKWDGCVCGWSQGSRGRCRPSPLHEKRGMFHRRLGQIRLNTTLTHCRACHRDPNHLAAFDRPALFRPWSFPDTKQWHRARRTWLPRMPNVGFPQFLVETAQSSVDGSRIARENLSFRRLGRVQSSVRPVDAANERLLALMGSANKVPICLSGYDASDRRRVVLVPGLTGIAITSLRSYNLVEPIDQLELVSVLRSPHRLGTWRAR